MAGPIAIAVVADVARARAGLNGVEGDLTGLGKKSSKLGAAAKAGFAVASAAAIAFTVSAVRSASDAQQSVGATETVFGKYADTVIKTSDKAAQAYGLSANEYRENANLLGALFKNQGVQMDQLAGKTQSFVGVGADLAATFGGTTKEAVEALGSAFKGEFDPLERYGISIKKSAINAELAASGQDKLTGAALKAAEQQATTKLIMEQASQAQGAFARESNTLAGQQQRLGAQWENIKATVGTALLPVLTALAATFNEQVLPAISAAWEWLSAKLGPVFQTVRGYVEQVTASFSGSSGLAQAVTTVQDIFAKVVEVVTPIVQDLVALVRDNWTRIVTWTKRTFDQARSTVSSGLTAIRTVVMSVLSVIQWLWKRFGDDVLSIIRTVFETVAGVVRGALNVLQGIFRTVSSVLRGDWSAAWDGIKQIVRGAVDIVVSIVRGFSSILWTVAKAAFGLLKDAAVWGAGKLLDIVVSIPGRVVGALGDLGSLLFSKGSALIQGLIDGIMSKIGAVGDAIGSIAGKVGGFFPGSPVKEGPLTSWNNGGAGKRLVELLASGLTDGSPLVASASYRLAGALGDGLDVSVPSIRTRAGDPAATTNDKLDQLIAALQALPREYRLNERLAYA